jgi:hypothetical protein
MATGAQMGEYHAEVGMYDIAFVRRLRARLAAEQDPRQIKAICDVLREMIEENETVVAIRMKLLERKHQRIAKTFASTESQPELPKVDVAAVRPD